MAILDRYLQQQASQDLRNYVAAVFVAVNNSVLNSSGQKQIIGFYSVSSTSVDARDFPLEITKKLPKYPILPATLIGRLAIATQYQKKGWGRLLLYAALQLALANEVASMAVIVDAKDERAVFFYGQYGFLAFPDQPYRLYLPMKTIARMLS
ncbi:GNAT family N-acetyltransferase [Thalassoporum mexicanum]|uniref:GNAT family N-acetyltransferase n=1 Tax=Thalassoporum mexicanum TaxID=3457544 RepID=UPI001CEC61BE|nr:GNAT family N-acetyltransferase [Pseudanabaena sp. PCC 7367]